MIERLFVDAACTKLAVARLFLPRAKVRHFIVFVLLAGLPAATLSQEQRCRTVDSDWIWFSDHVVVSVTYVTQGPQGRRYEIGTGISIGGKPRGSIEEAEGRSEVTAYGIGALHLRFVDGLGAGTLCAEQGSIETIHFPEADFWVVSREVV